MISIITVGTISFSIFLQFFILNVYLLAGVGESKNSQSQSFEILDKRPGLFKITKS
jgi:hypothetical protein